LTCAIRCCSDTDNLCGRGDSRRRDLPRCKSACG
jgi:hypothetical protein